MGTPADNVIVAASILRRTLEIDFPRLTDDELVLTAEETFLELDRREPKQVNR